MDSTRGCCTSAAYYRKSSAVRTRTIRTRTRWFCAPIERDRLDCGSSQGYASRMSLVLEDNVPDKLGHFGPYGGRFFSQTPMHPPQEIEGEDAPFPKDPPFPKSV